MTAEVPDSGLSMLLDLPDDAMVSVSPEFPGVPYARYASSPEGLRRLILEIPAPFPDADLGFLEDAIPHERLVRPARVPVGIP